ncbi:MAG: 3-phenylpropionate/cinnamic acid dioxygenase subunit beta [Pigmentiphaga sp.]|uniref:3-phenylpropionate/cinnamic acid dioxygenase subunit beta n=1 Tax=Pigmentiphaga sp. TaxID=1977564 RepID=UPI0029AB50D7|nr:3-phenylpropionate/cinnamic acid dioxygenase subunit beta [Pigmentiphaga sp.]MDX3904373.1 3-phenylpropionate/cinnamic acid dioxygenase subunit beta [Pigmentiphaga sp.]
MPTAIQPDIETQLADMLLLKSIEQFYYRQSDMLDARDYEAWLGTLDEGIRYWMPIARNVQSRALADEYTRPQQDTAWFDEGIETLRQRVEQFRTGMHWAEEPVSRVSHLVTNVRVVEVRDGGDGRRRVQARSRFLVYQNRLETETTLFVGKRDDTLIETAAGWKVRTRSIFLDQSVLLGKALTIFF